MAAMQVKKEVILNLIGDGTFSAFFTLVIIINKNGRQLFNYIKRTINLGYCYVIVGEIIERTIQPFCIDFNIVKRFIA